MKNLNCSTTKHFVFISLLTFAGFAGCSSSSSTPGNGGGGNTQQGNDAGGGGNGACSCTITFNDITKTLDCGVTSCVNGESFSCGSDAQATDKGACSTTGDDAGNAGHDAGGGGSCVVLNASCSDESAVCCSGTTCYSAGSFDDHCKADRGTACTSTNDCVPGVTPGSPGDICNDSHLCCGSAGAVCNAAGADSSCCSGTCVQTGAFPTCQ